MYPAEVASTEETNVRNLAQHVIIAVAQGQQPSDDDITAIKSLISSDPEGKYLAWVPEAAQEFFKSLVKLAAKGAKKGKAATDIAQSLLSDGFYDIVTTRLREDDSAEQPLQWTPYDLFVLDRVGDQNTLTRGVLQYSSIPDGLERGGNDTVLATANSREGLANAIGNLPVVTLHVIAEVCPYADGVLVEDVSQGGDFGDCWLLSWFAAIARNDPGLLRQVLPPDAPGYLRNVLGVAASRLIDELSEQSVVALALFWHDLKAVPFLTGTSTSFRSLSFSFPQMFELTGKFARKEGHLMGELSRVEPAGETWTLRITKEGKQYVQHAVKYRVIAWPALLEKAYTVYLKRFRGQAGYAIIAVASSVLGPMFLRNLYGPRIRKEGTVVVEPLRAALARGAAPDDQARQCLEALLEMHAQTQKRQQPGPDAVLMVTTINYPHVIERLAATLPKYTDTLKSAEAVAQAMGIVQQTEEAKLIVNEGVAELTDKQLPQGPKPDWEEINKQQAVNKGKLDDAIDLMLQEINPMLTNTESDPDLIRLRDILLTLRVPRAPHGNDTTAKRFLYCEHDYAVLDVNLKFTGQDGPVDPAHSTITLYNPHGQNSPNIDHDVPGDTGRFTLPLDRFLNVARKLDYTIVAR